MLGPSRKDYVLAAIVGFLVAVLLLIVGKNIAVAIPFGKAITILLPLASIFGLWVAGIFARRWAVFMQLAKFVLVGALNTFVDLGVLNALIFVTDIAQGTLYSAFKATAFTVAVINSYFWNKLWTFGAQRGGFIQFLLVSVAGLLINVAVASVLVNAIGAPGDIDIKLWANVAAIVATGASLVWNFIGYKFLVFRR